MTAAMWATISLLFLWAAPADCQSKPDAEGQGSVLVSLQSDSEVPLRAIGEIAVQTRVPIGIALGADRESLCNKDIALHLANIPVQEAVERIARPLGFLVQLKDGVLMLKAPDLTASQKSILGHRFAELPQQNVSSMAALGTRLTGAIRMGIGNETSFAASTLHSPDSHHLDLKALTDVSVEDVANQIVKLDKHGLWIFSGAAPKKDGDEAPSPRDATMLVFSYADDTAALQNLRCGQ